MSKGIKTTSFHLVDIQFSSCFTHSLTFGEMKFKVFLLLFVLTISTILATPTSITAPPVSNNVIESPEKDDLKQFLGHCLHKSDVAKCLKNRVVELIDEATHSNDDWKMSFFNMKFSLNRNPEFHENAEQVDESRTFEDVISQKLKSLMESRVFQVSLSENSDELETHEARKKKGGNKHGHSMMMMSGKF